MRSVCAGGVSGWSTELGFTTAARREYDVAENETVQKVSIYPNPAREQFTVHYALKDNEVLTVRLLDLTGRIVQVADIQAFSAVNSIDISGQPAGVYTVHIAVNGKAISTQKLVIVR
jgi:hypothetical protein